MANIGIDLFRTAEEIGFPLIGITANEAIKVLKTHACRPLVERSRLAGDKRRRVVILTEPRCAVAIVLEDLSDRRLITGDEAVVSRESGGLLGNHAETDRVMVAAGDERSASRRTQRGRIEVCIADSSLRDPVKCWCRDHSAKRTGHPESGVIGHDE